MPKPKSEEQIAETTVGEDKAGSRLDRFLASEFTELSRTRLKALILDNKVRVGGRTIGDPEYRVKPAERISLTLPPAAPAKPAGEKIPLDVVYEDDALIVINKPAGLVVHPGAGARTGTLVNALIAHCGESLSGIGGEKRPGIVHRLDKDTSGLLVVAKTDRAHRMLAAQFSMRGPGGLERGYLALVWGVPEPREGVINKPIGRDPHSRVKMAVRAGGRPAITTYTTRAVLAGAGGEPVASLLECRLATGRTHQIRVHLAKIGHPLLGDPVYGAGFRTRVARLSTKTRRALERLHRQALHAYLLGFDHPITRKHLGFEQNPPRDFIQLLSAFTAK